MSKAFLVLDDGAIFEGESEVMDGLLAFLDDSLDSLDILQGHDLFLTVPVARSAVLTVGCSNNHVPYSVRVGIHFHFFDLPVCQFLCGHLV